MKASQLKNSILNLAIQGKLVPQLETEPVAKQIGKQPDEIPFDIPDKWTWARLIDVGEFISGRTPKPYELSNTGEIPYFKVSDMNRLGNEKFLVNTELFLKENKGKIYEKGTIVFPKNGGAVFTNKRRILSQPSVVDLNTGGYVPGSRLDLEFTYLFLSNVDFKKISKGSALPTIDQLKLKNYLIPIPPLEEQKRIVAKIEELLPLIEEYDSVEQKLSQLDLSLPAELKKSILQETVQGKLVPQLDTEHAVEQIGKPPDEIPFDIPGKWKWISIVELVDSAKTKTPDRDFEYIDVGSIDNNSHSLGETKKLKPKNAPSRARRIVSEGMVLYSTVRPYLQNICIAEGINGREVIASTAFATAICKSNLLNKYLFLVLLSPYITDYVKRIQRGTSYPAITDKDFYEIYIPIPPLEEQKRIVAKVKELFLQTDDLAKQIELSST